MEVRADHLGATLIEGGYKQMAESLAILASKSDEAMNKAADYSQVEKDKRVISSLERSSLGWRILEFQFMPHPPMYWRIHSLQTQPRGWGKRIFWRWFKDRVTESTQLK